VRSAGTHAGAMQARVIAATEKDACTRDALFMMIPHNPIAAEPLPFVQRPIQIQACDPCSAGGGLMIWTLIGGNCFA